MGALVKEKHRWKKEPKLALDFLREQVVIWKYVYTCSIREKDQRLCEDDPEMGPACDFAC